jgi:hypothetical protein
MAFFSDSHSLSLDHLIISMTKNDHFNGQCAISVLKIGGLEDSVMSEIFPPA